MNRMIVTQRTVVSLVATFIAIVGAAQKAPTRSLPESVRPSSASDGVVVSNAWARPAIKGGTGGAYMNITNNGRQVIRIVGATAAIAASAELHVSALHAGMADMEMLPQLVITPGASVSLKPGGMHLMLVGLRRPLVNGDTTHVTLLLQNGHEIVVNVAVRTQ